MNSEWWVIYVADDLYHNRALRSFSGVKILLISDLYYRAVEDRTSEHRPKGKIKKGWNEHDTLKMEREGKILVELKKMLRIPWILGINTQNRLIAHLFLSKQILSAEESGSHKYSAVEDFLFTQWKITLNKIQKNETKMSIFRRITCSRDLRSITEWKTNPGFN